MKNLIDKWLQSPNQENDIKETLGKKSSLRYLYREIYEAYAHCTSNLSSAGILLELGSGIGFAKQIIPNLVTSDILPFSNIDLVLDATGLPFPDQSISAILMNNVFHHIRNVEAFLREADRCLMAGGRVFIADQNPGIFAKYIYKYLHHEFFNEKEETWDFTSQNPLRDANGALAWIVFRRDYELYRSLFPNLQLLKYVPHTPTRYWLCGGLKQWNLLPEFLYPIVTTLDRSLIKVSADFGSFAFIELEKVDHP